MRTNVYALLLALLAIPAACKQQDGSTVNSRRNAEGGAAAEVRDLVRRVMTAEYGAPESACYRYVDASAGLRYCLRVEPRHVHVIGDGNLLYFMAHSDPAEGDYDAVDPGILAAYEVRLKDGHVVSKVKALATGASGSCQCEQAQFLELGPAKFGWLFTTGGTWQGIDVYRYAIVAPVGGEFRDVSEVPQIEEDRQDVSYTVAVAPAPAAREFYPLDVRKAIDGKETFRMTVPYDPSRRSYHLAQ